MRPQDAQIQRNRVSLCGTTESTGITLFTVGLELRGWEKHALLALGREWIVIRAPHARVVTVDGTGGRAQELQ